MNSNMDDSLVATITWMVAYLIDWNVT
jgi:hypothetical protein